ncbi:MAG TPA: tetratricopeptide repeat protein [Anaeromyxobacteraceae bacterium]|nr:tetratricopeptide repeat protein [Anaeromyxobacteraceae bacterium]
MATPSTITHKDREQMKAPDRFQVTAGQAATWVQAHRKQVVFLGAAAVVVVVVATAVSTMRAQNAEAAGAALSQAMKAMAGEISSVPLPGLPGPFYATEQAKQQAVAEAADRVRRGWSGTAAAHTATLAFADAKLRLGDLDGALAAYREYLVQGGPGDSLAFSAHEGIGLAEEGKGNLDAAAQAFERLAREAPAYADRADLERARVLAQAGKVDEARKILLGFADAHKESALTGEAAERLAKLGAK